MSVKRTCVCIACAAGLAFAGPTQALAATDINIENSTYTAAAEGSGSGGGSWSWNGENSLSLDNFVSEAGITSTGPIDIFLTGANEVASLTGKRESYTLPDSETGGMAEFALLDPGASDISISNAGSGASLTTGKVDSVGDLSLEGTKLVVKHDAPFGADEYAAAVNVGDLSVDHATLEVSVTQSQEDASESLVAVSAGSVAIKDSTVSVDVQAKEGTAVEGMRAMGVASMQAPHDLGTISVDHSTVDVNLAPEGVAIAAWGQWMPDGAGLSDGAITLTDAKIAESDMHVATVKDYFGQKLQVVGHKSGELDPFVDGEDGEPQPTATTLTSAGVTIVPAAVTADSGQSGSAGVAYEPAQANEQAQGGAQAQVASAEASRGAVPAVLPMTTTVKGTAGASAAATTPKTADGGIPASLWAVFAASGALVAISYAASRRKGLA